MTDRLTHSRSLAPIHVVVRRARRRLRLQGALEASCAATPLAALAALSGVIAGAPVLLAGAAVPIAAAAVGALWPRRDDLVAARLDHASHLADRLTTAIAFDRRAPEGDALTRGLAALAIADGVRAAARADVRAAAPFAAPRHLRAALGSIALAAVIAALAMSPAAAGLGSRPLGEPVSELGMLAPRAEDAPRPALADDDLDYLLALLDGMRARAPDDAQLQAWADAVEAQLLAADRGELDRADLIAAIDGLSRPGEVDGLDDVLEGVRQARPPSEPPPPPEPPPPDGVCENPGPTDPDAPPPPPTTSPSGVDPGDDHLAEAGRTERERQPTQDEQLSGDRGAGPSRRKTVAAAARHGFAGAPYRQVYADYAAIVEEVLHTEAVPSAYRYVVKRYFHRIHPS